MRYLSIFLFHDRPHPRYTTAPKISNKNGYFDCNNDTQNFTKYGVLCMSYTPNSTEAVKSDVLCIINLLIIVKSGALR